MSRINVIGTSASGKSTFSRELAKKLKVPYIEMDSVFWEPDWKEPSDELFFERLRNALKGDSWVLDGNYNRTREIKWARVTTVIWLDYSFFRTLRQSITRSVLRAMNGKELWEGTGNRESLHRSFFSKESVVLWMLKTYGENRRKYNELLKDPRYKHITFLRLASPREARDYLTSEESVLE